MLSHEDAKKLARKEYPKGRIVKTIEYGDLFVFMIVDDADDVQGDMDPYVSVDRKNRVVSDFSIFTDVEPDDIALFLD